MVAFIKSMKTFEYICSYELYSWTLAEGASGDLKICDESALDRLSDFLGNWAIMNGKPYYISEVSPDEHCLSLTIESPIYAFDRSTVYKATNTTYGSAIKYTLENDYQNISDTAYKRSYISVTNSDSTTFTPEPDDNGYYVISEVMEAALENGVRIDFSISGSKSMTLNIAISTASYDTTVVTFVDGHSYLDSEEYSDERIAKITLVQTLLDSNTRTLTYYYSSDGKVSQTVPSSRATGKWAYETCSTPSDTDDAGVNLYTDDGYALEYVTSVFKEAEETHKIEFYSDRVFEFQQPLTLKMRSLVYTTKVTEISQESTSTLYHYTCGNLATTLTDYVKSSVS